MKYTLTWTVTKTVPAPCPDYKPDQYTGEYPRHHCLVYHRDIVTEEMSKKFETQEEAKDFASKAPSACSRFVLNGEVPEDTRIIKDMGNITTLEMPISGSGSWSGMMLTTNSNGGINWLERNTED